MSSGNASKDTSGSESGTESPCVAPADRQRYLYILRTGCIWRHLPKDYPLGYSRILLLSLEVLREVAKNLGSAYR